MLCTRGYRYNTLLLSQVPLDLTICIRGVVHNIVESMIRFEQFISAIENRIYLAGIFSRKCFGKYPRSQESKQASKRKLMAVEEQEAEEEEKEEEEGEILLCIHNFPEIKTAPRQSRLKLSRFFYVLLFNHGRARC